MSTSANRYGIEPQLLGTRYGAALEGAARDRLYRPINEQIRRDEWMKAHPECVSTTPVYAVVIKKTPDPIDPQTALMWAKVLAPLSETDFATVKGQVAEVRRGLLAHRLVEVRVTSGRFQYRRTHRGTAWLKAYRAAYQPSLAQASEGTS